MTPAGFEPGITGLKVLRPALLDEGAVSALFPGLIGLCDYLDLNAVTADDDLVDGHAEHGSQNDQIVDRGHGCPALPLVNGLGRGEAEDVLQILG